MQTDELRAGLRELANEEDAFHGDLPSIRRRVARRRVAEASIAIVVIAAVTIGAVAITHSNKKAVTVAHSVKEVELTAMPRVDAAVILPAGATEQDVARVAGILDHTGGVLRYSPLPARNAAYVLSFTTDKAVAAVRRRICSAPATRSFAVEVTHQDARAEDHLVAAVGGAGTVAPTSTRGPLDFELFMRVNATAAQIESVSRMLAHDPDVTAQRFIDREEAYREFKVLFAAQPALIENTKAADLPVSFRVTVRDGVDPSHVAQQLQGAPGVGQINTSSAYTQLPEVSLTLRDICSSKQFAVQP